MLTLILCKYLKCFFLSRFPVTVTVVTSKNPKIVPAQNYFSAITKRIKKNFLEIQLRKFNLNKNEPRIMLKKYYKSNLANVCFIGVLL